MAGSFGVWTRIISNPFAGYKLVTRETKIALPLVFLLILMAGTTTLLLPITRSEEYVAATLLVQQDQLRRFGIEPTPAQTEALQTQLRSPTTRTVTTVSMYLGGMLGYLIALLIVAALMKLLTLGVKERPGFRLLLRLLVFAGIVTAVQSLLKATITLSGDWRGALAAVRNTWDLSRALQSSLSLALFVPEGSLGDFGFTLLDSGTDIFNWLYYVFIYAGLRSAAGLTKSQALAVTAGSAMIYLAVSVGLVLLF